MNYYIVPRKIAESLDLTALRKCTPSGLYLLSESDLLPYGVDRAISEGAQALTSPAATPAVPVPAEEEHGQDNTVGEEQPNQEQSEEEQSEEPTNQEEEEEESC